MFLFSELISWSPASAYVILLDCLSARQSLCFPASLFAIHRQGFLPFWPYFCFSSFLVAPLPLRSPVFLPVFLPTRLPFCLLPAFLPAFPAGPPALLPARAPFPPVIFHYQSPDTPPRLSVLFVMVCLCFSASRSPVCLSFHFSHSHASMVVCLFPRRSVPEWKSFEQSIVHGSPKWSRGSGLMCYGILSAHQYFRDAIRFVCEFVRFHRRTFCCVIFHLPSELGVTSAIFHELICHFLAMFHTLVPVFRCILQGERHFSATLYRLGVAS